MDNNINSEMDAFQRSHQSNEIELLHIFAILKEKWLKITTITALGTIFAIAGSFLITKEYRIQSEIQIPTLADTEIVNSILFTSTEDKDLFSYFLGALKSEDNFLQFSETSPVLSDLIANSDGDELQALTKLYNKFEFLDLLPKVKPGEVLNSPTKVSISMTHSNEELVVDALNAYLTYTNRKLLDALFEQNSQIRAKRIENIEREINFLLADSEAKTKQEIELREKGNSLKIELLELQKEGLLTMSSENRETRLEQIKEAMAIATEMNIVDPTPLDEFGDASDSTVTEVKLSGTQTLPLYLMGTRYLTVLSQTLNERKSEEGFVSELSSINKQIMEIKADPELRYLKERESERLYTPEVLNLESQLRKLQSITINEAQNSKLYSLVKSARATGIAVSPNKPLIATAALLLSGMIAVIWVIMSFFLNRKTSI